ncbi:MAG: hypothetical protein OET63_09790 [Desulfobacterales bacterium]|nr:hypothetical protein [Desulfobacterales bacterium]
MGAALRKITDLPETISIFFASNVSSMKVFSAIVLAGNMRSKKSSKAKTDLFLLIVLDGSMNFIPPFR